MEEDTDFKKLPLDERCAHKLWKARVDGYEEAAKVFRQIDDEKSKEWMKYLGQLKKFVTDSNAMAQEKGLEATLAFIENSGYAGKTVEDVMSGIVAKCIAAPKTKTRELSVQIALMYIEVEKQDLVIEELLKGTEHKNPKIVSACTGAITQALKEFGAKVLNVKIILKRVPVLLCEKDKAVRDESKALTIELYRWIGVAIKNQLSSMQAVLLTELEAEFDKVKDDKPVPQRYLRSQQAKQAKIASEIGGGEAEECEDEADAGPEIDPFDLLDPVDILSKIPKDFYEKLESKKWQERKESLDALELLLKAPKLENGDYGDVVRVLRHVINKDTNVMLVALAGKCLGSLALGLKKGFTPYALSCVSLILEKFKEKKANVVTALRDAIDAIYPLTNIEAIMEDCLAALGNKNPSVRAESGSFLARAFSNTQPAALNKKLLKSYVAALLKNLNDSDPNVRDHAAEALGTAMKLVGEKNILPFMVDLDNLKMTKIKECCEKAVINVKVPVVKKAVRPASAVEKTEVVSAKPKNMKPPAKRPGTGKKPVAKPLRKPSEEEEDDLSQESNDTKGTSPVASADGTIDISAQITEALINELSDKNWNTRNDALMKVQGIIGTSKIKSSIGELPQALASRLIDSNSKIAQNALAICQTLATAMGPSCKQHVRSLFPGFLHGLGDGKTWIRSASITCMNTWGDQCGYKEFFDGEMIFDVLKGGTPTLRSELWAWLAEKLPNIPPKSIPKDELLICLPILYSNMEDRNADVRKNANEAVLGIMMHLNYEPMLKSADKLKPASSTLIKKALEAVRPSLPMLPTKKASVEDKCGKGVAGKSTGTKTKLVKGKAPARSGNKKEEEMDNSPVLCINNLKHQRMIDEQKLRVLKWNFVTPREEFIDLLKDQMTTAGVNRALMANMFHSDFRHHVTALENLTENLLEDSQATVSNLDLILKWLTLRFFDTNPTVLMRGLEYLQVVFQVLIEQDYLLTENEASSFLPYLILKVGDPKENIRLGVRALFRQLCHIFSVNKLFSFVIEGLKSKNARQRQECLDELAVLIANYGVTVCQPSLVGALKEVVKQISDRDNSVRNAALNCVVQVYHIQSDKIYKVLGQLQINEKDQSLLDERIKRASKNRPAQMPSTATIVKSRAPPTPVVEPEPDIEIDEEEIIVEDLENQENISPTLPSPIRNMGSGGMGSPNQRPISGPYGLDTDLLARIEKFKVSLPKTNIQNIDLNFLSDPVQQIKSHSSVLTMPTRTVPERKIPATTAAVPANIPPMHQASSRPDIESLIIQIGSSDLPKALRAVGKMEDILNSTKANQMTEYEDQFITAVVAQFKLLNTYSVANFEEVSRGFRALFTVLTVFYDGKVVGRRISIAVLYDLMEQILALLVDKKFDSYDGSTAYQRVINSLCFKILERSDHSNITCALIKLMHSCYSTTQCPRYAELVMKCLWKIIKNWTSFADDLDYEIVLNEINIFYISYPASFWKRRPSDTPFKTIKTLLHSMVKQKGSQIMQYVNKISDNLEPELHLYIVKLVKSMCPEDGQHPIVKESLRDHHRKMSRSNHEQLSIIFKKIGNKTCTKEGLAQLYEFRQANPGLDIWPFLKDSSLFFKQYIETGLREIEQSKQSQNGDGLPTRKEVLVSEQPKLTESESNGPVRDPTYYLNRLKEHMSSAPQRNSPVINNDFLDNRSADENLNETIEVGELEAKLEVAQVDSVAHLRQKLEQIRKPK